MTREEAIKVLSNIDHAWRNFSKEEYCVLDMAIKALKQESILDKIRKEIVSMLPEETDSSTWEISKILTLREVIRRIDKYRAEIRGIKR